MDSRSRSKAGIGVRVIRHKTKKPKLTTGQRVFVVLGTLVAFGLIALALCIQ